MTAIGSSRHPSFTTADLEFMAKTLPSKTGNFYFSLDLWVIGNDGTIKAGHLQPTATKRIEPLTVSGDALKIHYEGGLGLRCIKRR